MSEPRIRVEHIGHRFGDSVGERGYEALRDVSFDVGPGEFLSIVGPSGCGKTTLLNMIEGFLTPDTGRVLVDGRPVLGIQADKIAYMFARDNLLPWRRVLGNIELAMEMGGRRPSRAKALELLRLVGLNNFGLYYPAQLSQGMRQRVAMARTLAVDASIWLMDEPFAALDVNTKTLLQDEFLRIWEASRKAVVFVTHDLTEAIALSDRVLVLSPGPGRVKSMHTIDLPRPRRVLELHANAAFFELYRRLWDELRGELGGQQHPAGRTVPEP